MALRKPGPHNTEPTASDESALREVEQDERRRWIAAKRRFEESAREPQPGQRGQPILSYLILRPNTEWGDDPARQIRTGAAYFQPLSYGSGFHEHDMFWDRHLMASAKPYIGAQRRFGATDYRETDVVVMQEFGASPTVALVSCGPPLALPGVRINHLIIDWHYCFEDPAIAAKPAGTDSRTAEAGVGRPPTRSAEAANWNPPSEGRRDDHLSRTRPHTGSNEGAPLLAANRTTEDRQTARKRFDETLSDARKPFPHICTAIAQGVLPSQYCLGIGTLSIGPRSIGVGTVEIHRDNLQRIVPDSNPQTTSDWATQLWPEQFGDRTAAFIRLQFSSSRTSPIDRLLLGFEKTEDASAAATALSDWSGLPIS